MAKERAVYIGARLRRLRRDLGLTQVQMAGDLGISPSYVALMERNQRAITAEMLLRLATTYQIDLAGLGGGDEDALATRLGDIMRDPLFSDIDLAPMESEDVATGYPGVAEALARVYTAYRESQIALADQGTEQSVAADPVAEARRFLTARRNTFPSLDDQTERLARTMEETGGPRAYLEKHHGLTVRRLPSDVMSGAVRRLDYHRRELVLDETLDAASRTFNLCLQVAYLELQNAMDAVLAEGDFETDNARNLTRRSLANYAAGALMMPYRAFVKAAEARRYDLEALARQFGASFEQIAHRLTTLQKPGQEGVPFFFIRVDAAGNVSKRLDGAGFPFARHGGSCPLWSVHEAFKAPRKLITQWIELPDGERFFSIARTVTAGGGAYGAARIERAIALSRGNIVAAAKLLEINPSTIYRKKASWGEG